MAGGRFSKQAIYSSFKQWTANNANDTIIGGNMAGAPGGFNASQGFQTLPGDRTILSPSDALIYSNNNSTITTNLFAGTYRYMQNRNNSTANPTRGRAAFIDQLGTTTLCAVAGDQLYQVTADGNTANITETLCAGVYINNITLSNGTGSYWWIQESGKAVWHFINAITGTPTIGAGCYLPLTAPANNNATDNGSLDQLVAANSAAIFTANSTTGYSTVDGMIVKYVGVAENLPANNALSIVSMPFTRGGYRW